MTNDADIIARDKLNYERVVTNVHDGSSHNHSICYDWHQAINPPRLAHKNLSYYALEVEFPYDTTTANDVIFALLAAIKKKLAGFKNAAPRADVPIILHVTKIITNIAPELLRNFLQQTLVLFKQLDLLIFAFDLVGYDDLLTAQFVQKLAPDRWIFGVPILSLTVSQNSIQNTLKGNQLAHDANDHAIIESDGDATKCQQRAKDTLNALTKAAGAANSIKTLFIDEPLRSGASVIHHGDIVIASFVSNGAEVVSTGNIHIYGEARGRLVAGSDGDTTAKIFVSHFNPELISIGGIYKSLDTKLPANLLNKTVMVSVNEKKRLVISPLSG